MQEYPENLLKIKQGVQAREALHETCDGSVDEVKKRSWVQPQPDQKDRKNHQNVTTCLAKRRYIRQESGYFYPGSANNVTTTRR